MQAVRLTAKSVPALAADGGCRIDYRDELLRGLILRVSPTGTRTFALVYKRRGKKRRYTLGPYPKVSLALARKAARKLLARIALGDDPQEVRAAERRATLTVADLVDACLEDLHIRPSTRREWERLARVEIRGADMGGLPAALLQRRAIRGWADTIKRRSDYTANRAWELLRRAYSWGVQKDMLTATPFLPREPKPGIEREADRVLTALEVGALWRALEDMEGQYADATRLLLLTGVRREMVLGARAGELEGLDGEDPRWTVPAERSKSGRPHVVPLCPETVEIVRRRLEYSDDYLFPPARAAKVRPAAMWWSSRFVRGLHKDVDEEHGSPLPPWRIHSLRHTVGTHLTEDLGVDPAIVSLILGHTASGPRVSARYNRAERLPERREALSSWAGLIIRWSLVLGRQTGLRKSAREKTKTKVPLLHGDRLLGKG